LFWLKDIPEVHRDKVKQLILENLVLRERLRLERFEKYGPAAEGLTDAQLELLELEPGVNAAEVEAEAHRAQLQLPLKNKIGGGKRPTGRQRFVARAAPGRTNHCPCVPTTYLRQMWQTDRRHWLETAEQLDREPAKYFVRVSKREKRAYSSCAQGGIQTAALSARIIKKSIVSDQVIIDTVVANRSVKYCDLSGHRCEMNFWRVITSKPTKLRRWYRWVVWAETTEPICGNIVVLGQRCL
jgi:hypothetical protein